MTLLKKLFVLSCLGLSLQFNLNAGQDAEISQFIQMLQKESNPQKKDIAQWLNTKLVSSDDIDPMIILIITNQQLSPDKKIILLNNAKMREIRANRINTINTVTQTLGALIIMGLGGISLWLQKEYN